MYGNTQNLYDTYSYRNPPLSHSYNQQNKSLEYQNLNKPSQLNMVGRMAVSTPNYHYIKRSPTPVQQNISKNNSTIDVSKQNNLSETINKNFLNNYYNYSNKQIGNQYNNNREYNNTNQYNNNQYNNNQYNNNQYYNNQYNINQYNNNREYNNNRQYINNQYNNNRDYNNNRQYINNQYNNNRDYNNNSQEVINKSPQYNTSLYSNQIMQRNENYIQKSNRNENLLQNPQNQIQKQYSYLINNTNNTQNQRNINPYLNQNNLNQTIFPYQKPNLYQNNPNQNLYNPQNDQYKTIYYNPQTTSSNLYQIKTPFTQRNPNLNPYIEKNQNLQNTLYLSNLKNENETIQNPQSIITKYSTFTIGGRSIEGKNKTNQDSSIAKNHSQKEYTFGVFDGHGPDGHLVSQSIKQYFEMQPNTNLSSKENLQIIFSTLSKQITSQKNFDTLNSGSTVVLVHITPNKIICANCGDSRAILITNPLNNIIELSHDHKPEVLEERRRIEESGGRVFQVYGIGPYRVWMRNTLYPGLAMSRSIGDSIAHSIGVSDIPEILEFDVRNVKPLALVVASDGVWEFLSNQDVKEEVGKFLFRNDCDMCARSICQRARNAWERNGVYCDDITAVVAFFKD